jgi:hypothetical protein
MAKKLGVAERKTAEFLSYVFATRSGWLRASELESPAPRGHFLRTMGQSDRDFVENANPNASIPQALALMNGETVSGKVLLSPYSPLMRFATQAKDPREAAFIAILSRRPTAAESALLAQLDLNDVIYALLNTKQFLFIQ